jgi:cytoskeletal protein RodZ
VRLLLERLNSPIAFAVVLMVFLALDGFLFYRYQQALQSTADEAVNAPVEEASPSLEEESTVTEETSSSVEEEPTAAEETTPSPEEEQAKNAPAQYAPAQDVPVPAEDVPIEDVPAELPS